MSCLDPDATAAHIERARDLRALATRAALTAPLRALAAVCRPFRRPPTAAGPGRSMALPDGQARGQFR